jgi:hypothetical protein
MTSGTIVRRMGDGNRTKSTPLFTGNGSVIVMITTEISGRLSGLCVYRMMLKKIEVIRKLENWVRSPDTGRRYWYKAPFLSVADGGRETSLLRGGINFAKII